MAPIVAPSDAPLAERIRSGDRSADATLAQRYSRGVTIILRRAGCEPSVLDDLHQETFRIALETIRRGDLRDPGGLSGFVAGVARNLATEHFRRKERFPAPDRVARLEGEPSVSPSPLERLVQREEAERVRSILGELSTERDREVLRRFYLSSEDKGRICEDLGLTPLQFNRILYRARERYRALYQRSVKEKGE